MDADLFLVVGLGNPGPDYSNTRHNIGFEVVDALAERHGAPKFQKKFKSLVAQIALPKGKVILLKPQTYMNLSGEAVREACTFYKVDLSQQLYVISDDLDLPAATLRIRMSGGSGGHNGINSLLECLGTEAFPRFRIGIGRPTRQPIEDYVLQSIPKTERALFDETVKTTADAVEAAIADGLPKAMNAFNKKKSEP